MKTLGWHEQRFIERKSAIHCKCEVCNRDMWFPPSKAGKYKTCGGDCKKVFEKREVVARTRPCQTCRKLFTPRAIQVAKGMGLFCSQKCNTHGLNAMLSKESKKKSTESFNRAIAEGRYKPAAGVNNPRWMGGPKAFIERATKAGKTAEWCRRYRKNNPEKVREFTQRRKSKKLGRLPNGTVAAIGISQKWKCVVCKCDIRNKYHVDHIQPLAKGGSHVRTNIQLLCPSCNVRKSAKDPIEFMQSRGFLL